MTIFLSLILLLIKMCSFTFILKLLVKILKLELSSMKDFAHYSSYTDVNSRRLGEIIVYALIIHLQITNNPETSFALILVFGILSTSANMYSDDGTECKFNT